MSTAAVVPLARLRTEDLVPMSGFFSTPKSENEKSEGGADPKAEGGDGGTVGGLFNSYFSKISKTVQGGVKNFNAQDLTEKLRQKAIETHNNLVKEKDNFVKIMKDDKAVDKKREGYKYPWDVVSESDVEARETVKQRVIKLSEYQSNFLNSPPDESGWTFDYNENAKVAMNLMQIDGRLSKMRFKLVPSKMKEVDFWSHYFYCVSLIIENYTATAGVVTEANENGKSNASGAKSGAMKSAKSYETALDAALDNEMDLNLVDEDDDDDIDFVSNDIANMSVGTAAVESVEEENEEDIVNVTSVKDDGKLATSNEDFEDDLDWQKELEAELNAELGE